MFSRNNADTGGQKLLWSLVGAGGMLLLILLVALLTNVLVGGDLAQLSRDGRNMAGIFSASFRGTLGEQARVMALPLESGSQAYWYLARAGGVVAYILLWLATCWGIMMSSKVVKGLVGMPAIYSLHEYLPILGVVFAALHALVLLGDSYIGFNIWQLVVPFTSPYEPLWTGLGTIALYLLLALIGSTYLRKQIGQKLWRAFHYTSYLAFLVALLHGVMAGSDSGTLGMRTLYLVTGGISLFLLYYRMLAYAPRNSRSSAGRLAERRTESNAH